jgi:two-component system probable response regulator PhcQ
VFISKEVAMGLEQYETDPYPVSPDHLVIYVDDDIAALGAVQRLLRKEPYTLLTTTVPQQAIDWASRRHASLLLSDYRMPEMTGIEVSELAEDRAPGTPVVVVTAYVDRALKLADSGRRVREIIEKPWEDDKLRKTIRLLLRERELQEHRMRSLRRDAPPPELSSPDQP